MQQDELAQLFAANLSLAQPTPQPAPQPQSEAATEQQVEQTQEQRSASAPIVYASQHYTHSYHVVPPAQTEPQKTHIDVSDLGDVLRRHSIDITTLFPSQIDLFQNAADDQRLRLIELWRISPPKGRQGIPEGLDYSTSRQLYDWPPTSLAQEEAMAKMRYESLMQERAQSEEIQMHQQQLDQSMDQDNESAAVQATRGLLTSSSSEDPGAEPYIVSGYDMLARREYEKSAQGNENPLRESTKYNQATDPVYNHSSESTGLWQQKQVGSIIDMENQYGAFAYARDRDVGPIYTDEEMVM